MNLLKEHADMSPQERFLYAVMMLVIYGGSAALVMSLLLWWIYT